MEAELLGELTVILQSYLALVPPARIPVPSNLSFEQIHTFLVENILLLPHANTYPPSQDYQLAFWKWAINLLEHLIASDTDLEVDERIYERYTSLMILGNSSLGSSLAPPQKGWVTYLWPKQGHDVRSEGFEGFHSATLLESRSLVEQGTTGLRTWSASFSLAQYLLENPELVSQKTVLELGSGTGFLGIVASVIQAKQNTYNPLWLSDVNSEVIQRCWSNLRLPCNRSSSHPALDVVSLDWNAALPDSPEYSQLCAMLRSIHADVVIGADVVFDPSLVPPLAATIKLLLSLGAERGETRHALIALTIRNQKTFDLFTETILNAGLTIDQKPVDTEKSLFAIHREEVGDVRIMDITLANVGDAGAIQ